MESHSFLIALATVLGVAAFTTVLFQRLKQPVVLGYILAGLLVGPHMPIPLVADATQVQTLSELGVILLMFSLGLEFSLRKLLSVGPKAALTAIIQCSLMFWLGETAGQALGWTDLESLFLGAALAISSTTIIAKAFEEQGVGGGLRDLVLGILIVQDLIAVLLMAALTGVAKHGSLSLGLLTETSGRLALFLVAVLLLGLWLVPKGVRSVLRLRRTETTVVAAVGFSFVLAVAALKAGYSVALGAFLAGALVAESGRAHGVEQLVRPVRDVFAAIFFVSVGMLLDPALALAHWQEVLFLTLLVLSGQFISVGLGAFFTGNGIQLSVRSGLSLAQIGEFSFIVAGLGLALGATRPFLYPVVVAVSALTTLATPFLLRHSKPAAAWVDRKLPRSLQTFASLYAHWIERLGQAPNRQALSGKAQALGRLLLLDAAALLLLAVMGRGFSEDLVGWMDGRLGLGRGAGYGVVLSLMVALGLPFFFGIVRVTRALGSLLADAVFPVQSAEALDLAAAPRRAMVAALQWVSILLVTLPLLALTQPLFRGWGGPTVLVLGLAVLAWLFWRQAHNLEGHVKAGSELLAETLRARLSGQSSSPGEEPASLPDFRSGMGEPVPLRLGPDSPALGRSLSQLELRGRTGATVLVIVHADGNAMKDLTREPLAEGDTLVLAGPGPAVEAAKELLLG